MTAQVVRLPNNCSLPPPMTERQRRHERMAELIYERAQRNGVECSMEKARASLTQALLSMER